MCRCFTRIVASCLLSVDLAFTASFKQSRFHIACHVEVVHVKPHNLRSIADHGMQDHGCCHIEEILLGEFVPGAIVSNYKTFHCVGRPFIVEMKFTLMVGQQQTVADSIVASPPLLYSRLLCRQNACPIKCKPTLQRSACCQFHPLTGPRRLDR